MAAGASGQLAARAAVNCLTLSGPWAIQARGGLERMRDIGAFVAPLSEVKPTTLQRPSGGSGPPLSEVVPRGGSEVELWQLS